MSVHPLWRPFELADLDEVARARVGAPPPRSITVVDPDDRWPGWYSEVEARVRAALGDLALAVEHVGSTAVPGLAAKPIVDADLTVADSADEDAYVPALEAAGFTLRIREPAWEEHRLLTLEVPSVNLHVFSPGSPELGRHVLFRDRLRTHPVDREAYGALKLALGRRGFTDGMDYNNHKAEFVYDLYERIFTADPACPHDPQPRP